MAHFISPISNPQTFVAETEAARQLDASFLHANGAAIDMSVTAALHLLRCAARGMTGLNVEPGQGCRITQCVS